MPPSTTADLPLALGHAEQSYVGRFQWLVPALIGLSAPLLFAVLVVPSVIEHARPFFSLLLASLAIIGGAAATVAVILRGNAVGLKVDRTHKVVQVYLENMFATNVKSISFADVTDFVACERRDQDGFAYTGAILTTAKGVSIQIEASLTSDEIAEARAAIGLPAKAA